MRDNAHRAVFFIQERIIGSKGLFIVEEFGACFQAGIRIEICSKMYTFKRCICAIICFLLKLAGSPRLQIRISLDDRHFRNAELYGYSQLGCSLGR